MRIAVLFSYALSLGAASLVVSSAQAQGTQAQTSGSVQASSHDQVAVSEPAPEEKDEESEDPMGWIGIGVKVGLAYVGSSNITLNASDVGAPTVNGMQIPYSHTFATPQRTGVQVSVPINLGGDGFGWVVEPFMHFAAYRATGIYTGPTINLHLADPVYFGFGFGPKVDFLKADELNFGIDIGGRVPFTLHWYLGNDLALVGEAAIGYTATGIIKTPAPGMEAGDISFGGAFAWDFGVGIRFP
ncbi:MAG: hypothetical protein QM778_09075 [Myxococcales bacterium]